jgi:hypothetical protein
VITEKLTEEQRHVEAVIHQKREELRERQQRAEDGDDKVEPLHKRLSGLKAAGEVSVYVGDARGRQADSDASMLHAVRDIDAAVLEGLALDQFQIDLVIHFIKERNP